MPLILLLCVQQNWFMAATLDPGILPRGNIVAEVDNEEKKKHCDDKDCSILKDEIEINLGHGMTKDQLNNEIRVMNFII